ncbi:MAG: PAS domain S-box protein [bacterium]
MKTSQKLSQELENKIRKYYDNKGVSAKEVKILLQSIKKIYIDFDKSQKLLEDTLNLKASTLKANNLKSDILKESILKASNLKASQLRDIHLKASILKANLLKSSNLKEGNLKAKLLKEANEKLKKETRIHSEEVALNIKKLNDKTLELVKSVSEKKALIGSLGEGVVAVNEQGVIVDINKVGLKLLDFKEKELLGELYTYKILMEDEDGNHIPNEKRPLIRSLKNRRPIKTVDSYYIRRDGTRFPISQISTPVGLDHKFSGAMVIFDDITKFKERAKNIQESEFFFKKTQEAAYIGSYKADFVLDSWKSSETMDKIFGIGKNFKRNIKNWLGLIHPDDREMMNKYLTEEILEKHKYFNKEYRIIRKSDHKIRWVVGLGKVGIDKYSKAVSLFGTIQDITERKLIENEVLEATNLTKDIIDNTNSLVYMVDKHGRFIMVNKKFENLFGVKRDEIIGKTRAIFLPLKIAKQHRKNDLLVLKTNKIESFDERNLEKDGEHFYLSQKFPVADAEGNVYAVAGISEDITTRKNLERQNEESRKLLDEAQKISKVGSFSLDLKTNEASISEELVKIYGLPIGTKKISNEKFLSLVHPGDRKRVMLDIVTSIQTGIANPQTEYRIVLENGNERIIQATSKIIFDDKKIPIKFFGTSQDITERKLNEDKLKKSEELFHSIVSSINEGIVMNDKNGKVILINPSAEKILGRKVSELEKINLKERIKAIKFVRADGTALLYEDIPSIISLKTGKSQRGVVLGVPKNGGEVVWISVNSEPLFSNSDSEPYAVVTTFRDITREREIEKLRVDFLSLVSHQLRTPLSGTKWLIETMQRGVIGETNQKEKEYLNSLYEINERMISLVADILNVLTLESGVVVLKKDKISVRELYKDISLIMEPAAKSKNINLINKLIDHKEYIVKSDFLILRSILENFISNSICYSASGQEIAFDVIDNPNEIVFSIKDNGIGIPEDEQARIFERFYRGSNAKMVKPSGTGLGLYTSTLLAKRIGAIITFESKEGKGTSFYLHIPKNHGT